MTLNDIEKKVVKSFDQMLMTHKQEDIDREILEVLVNCIKNNIKVILSEYDIIRIANMYYSIFHQYNLTFLKQIIKYSNNEIDIYKILNKLDIL